MACTCAMPGYHATVHFMCICVTIHKVRQRSTHRNTALYLGDSSQKYPNILTLTAVKLRISENIPIHYMKTIVLRDTVIAMRRVSYSHNTSRGLIREVLLPILNMLDKNRKFWWGTGTAGKASKWGEREVALFLGASKTKASEIKCSRLYGTF